MSLGLFIAISIGVALGVILGIGMLTFVYSCYTRRKLNRKTTWRNEENVLLKEPGAATCNEPQYIVTKLAAGGASMTMPSNECDKYHKTFIPMMPLHMGHGDHLYESTRVGAAAAVAAAAGSAGAAGGGTYSLGSAPVLNSDDNRAMGSQHMECDSGVVEADSVVIDPPDIQFVDILKPSLQHGGPTGSSTTPRVPRASDFHIYSHHEDYSRAPLPACHVDTIICPIHQCHNHQQQQQQQLQHSVHSLIAQEEET